MPAPKRILVIDDADDVRILVERQLVRLGYAAEGAQDGVEGLEAIARNKPDLVLCDLRMPRLDGLGVLAELREKYPQLPVVVMSGEGLLQDAVSALRLGAWDYLSKPIAGMPVLQHAVGKALEKAELIAENQRQRDKLEMLYRELADDQDAGRRLQLSLLPRDGMQVGSFTLTRQLLPSSFLSGDFCSTFSLPDGRWGFYLADVAGHGVPSALVTVMLRTVVERWVLEGRDASFFSPPEFLKALNLELIRQQHEKHVALFYGLVDEKRGTLACGNAGCFPWPVLIQDGNTFTLELPGMPLGLLDSATYDERIYELHADAKFVACTDGIFDVMDGGSVDDKSRRIAEAAANSATARELVEVLGLTEHRARPDDVAVLMLKRGDANALRTS